MTINKLFCLIGDYSHGCINNIIKYRRKFFFVSFLLTLITIFSLFVVDYSIARHTAKYIYTDIDSVPEYPYALILGTAKYVPRSRQSNLFYQYRIEATVQLYNKQKFHKLLVSGDNGSLYYNEPITMAKDLTKNNIKNENLILDYAGFTTLDSIVRAKKIFGINKLLIISQKFHCERALLIAHHYNIDAICFAAQEPADFLHYKVKIREYFARIKVLIDLFITQRQPKFLGKKEYIENTEIIDN